MSALAGIVRTDGAPVERELLRQMTDSLAGYGPDARGVWADGPVGFGHALLRTVPESAAERQPMSLDGRVWMVADARVDARADLVRALRVSAEVAANAPDAELILRAYLQWGEQCLDRLIGDFAFAIWDDRTRRLFCACDHLGVKSLYYAAIGRWLLFGSTIECLRTHPAVSSALNDLAIADFVLFDGNLDPRTTAFADIQNLPPAHTLTWSAASGLRLSRYWTMPVDEPIYYRRSHEYVEQFQELLREAVSDRLRCERVNVFMSGGIDSPGLAAAASDRLGDPGRVQGITWVLERLLDDSERRYARMAADYLGIPLQLFVRDEPLRWRRPGEFTTPEPVRDLLPPVSYVNGHAAAAAHSPVVLYGEGPDNALIYEWQPHLRALLHEGRWARTFFDVGVHVVQHRRIPLVSSIPAIIRTKAQDSRTPAAGLPDWFGAAMVDRVDWKAREHHHVWYAPAVHPFRPRAYESLHTTLWQRLFRSVSTTPGVPPLEIRHPYLDVRLLRFMLRVPAMPWCRKKHLLRRALRNQLPELLLARPKTPLPVCPDYELAIRKGFSPIVPSPRLDEFCNASRMPTTTPDRLSEFHILARISALSHWLFGLDSVTISSTHPQEGEVRHELVTH